LRVEYGAVFVVACGVFCELGVHDLEFGDGKFVWAKSEVEREEEMVREAQRMEKKKDGEV
jgi:hypothetical protein